MEKSRKILLSLSCLILLIIFTACSGGQCDHVFGSWQMINEATCIDYGLEERTCNECGQIDSREISPTNNHDYQFSYEEKGDCNNAGRTVFSCKYCGLEKEEKGEKSEHQYQERIVMDPNCSNEGIKLFECQNCGYSYEERIGKTSHNYVLNHINNSTCYEEGYELYQCNTCGHSYENKLEKLSHDFQYSCTFEPSCGSEGYDEYRCSNCGDVEHRNVVPSTEKHTLQHISGDVKCGESGYINYVCQYCSYTEERYEQSPYTKHNFVDGVCTNCNSLIYKYEIVDGYAQLVDIYDKDIEELVVPYDDGNGRRVMSIDQIDWSKFKNLKRIKFNNAINFYKSNFSGMDSLEEVHIWDLNSWVTSEMFTYPYNNPLSNGAKLYVNGEQLTSVDLKEFDYVRSYAFAGLIAENLDYNKTELVSNTAFDGATFDLVFVYRNATNLASCNIDKLVYKGESIELNGIEFNNVNKIMVTKDVKHIGGNVSDFKYDIHVNNISDWLSIDLSYPIFDEDTKLYVDGDLAEVVITPEETTRIGDYNLHGASFIKTLILNEWVEYLGEYSIDCENVEELYYYIVDAAVHTYSNIRVKNLKKLILGETIKNTPKIEFDSTIDEVHIHENVESINLRGHIKDLYVNSNTLDVTDYLSRIDYDNLYIGENVDSINPSNFKRDIYNIEYTNDEYSIIVLNDNAVFSTNELVSDIGGTITITAPAQMLKQFGASVVYNDVTVTGSGDAKVIGVFKNKITIGSGITSIQVKDDYMTNHDYKYTLEVLGDSIEFVDKFDRCSNLSFANLTALFKSNFESGNPLTDGASLIYNKEEVRSLTVPSGITYLPDKIFEKYRIDSIDLNEIEIIGVNSFAWANIGNIIINEGLKEIKDNAFANSDIEELLFPSTLEKIGYGAFSQTPIKEFIPKSAIEIGSYAFSNCKELKTVNFNSYPQNLGNNSFYNCGIEYLTISSGSTGEVVSAFDGCYNIKEYDVPTLEGYTSQTILKSEVPFKLRIRSGSFWPITNSNLKELVLGSEVEVPTTNNIQCDGLLKLTIEEGATVSSNFIDETKCHKLVEVVNLTDTELELSSDVVVKTSDDVSNFEVVNDLVLYSNEGLVYIVDYLGSNSKVDLTELNLNREYIVRKYCFGYRSADEHPSSYNIEEISIGDNITRLEDFALGYNNISKVHLPYSLEYISPSAFAFNPLTYISIDVENPNYFIENGNIITNDSNTILIGTNGVISNNIEGIADYAFSGRLITQVNIPNSVTSIGYKAFERSYYIEEFIYNASISEGDFNPIKISYYETPLTTVIIGENTNVLPNYFMANSSGIKEVIFNCTNPTVGNEAFNNCSNLAKVTFNYEFKNIGQRMFKSCSKLATVNAENEFNTIGYQAFSDCISLEDITPLLDVNYIYDYAFSNCGIYSNIKLDFTNIQYIAKGAFSSFRPTVDELIIDSIVDKGFNSSSAPITKLTDIFGTYGTPIYKIIYTGTTVTENAFKDCYYVTSIECPNVITIEALAFNNCSSLENLHLPVVEEIADYAFNNISDIKEIKLPDTVLTMGSRLFVGCDNLESITLPFIGKRDLNINEFGIEQLLGEYFEGANPNSTKEEYVNVSQVHYVDLSYNSNNERIYYLVPSTLRTITILDGKIGNSTFMNFSMVEEIIIESEEVDVIGYSSFYGCKSLKNLEISSNYTSILGYAFSSCESLEEFTIPSSCVSIAGNVFTYTPKLASLNVDSQNPNYYSNNMNAIVEKVTHKLIAGCKNTEMDSTVKIIASEAFKGASELYKINIPSSLESFEGKNQFYDCSNLTVFTGSSFKFYTSGNVLYQQGNNGGIILVRAGKGVEEIIEGVTVIETNAFENELFTDLTVILPSTITTIEMYAFNESCTFDKMVFTEYSGTWYSIHGEIDLSHPGGAANAYWQYNGNLTKR